MAKKQRRNHGAGFKAKVALEAIKEEETRAALSERYHVHPTQISEWKKQLLDRVGDISSKGSKPAEEPDIKALHSKMGRLTMENDFLAGALGRIGDTSATR